jgi:hypothetical protein
MTYEDMKRQIVQELSIIIMAELTAMEKRILEALGK